MDLTDFLALELFPLTFMSIQIFFEFIMFTFRTFFWQTAVLQKIAEIKSERHLLYRQFTFIEFYAVFKIMNYISHKNPPLEHHSTRES